MHAQQVLQQISVSGPAIFSRTSRSSRHRHGHRAGLTSLRSHKTNIGRRPGLRRVSASSISASEATGGYDYDLFCIGAGSGGVRASRVSAGYGARVAICEMPYSTKATDTLGGAGGTCVLRGCVPKKLLVFGSHFSADFADATGFGWTGIGNPTHDWAKLMAAKNKDIQRLNGVYKNILTKNGVKFIEGRGSLVDAHTVDVSGERFTAKHILIATGARPIIPDIPGKEHAISSDEALDLETFPKRIVILGAGYIGMEFAGIFNAFGAEVHLVCRMDRPLRGFDEEVRTFLAGQIKTNGINWHGETSCERIEKIPSGERRVTLGTGKQLVVDQVMFATGRSPNTKFLGLGNAGVKVGPMGAVVVDEFSRTTCPSVWAVGDVTGRKNLTPVATMEGVALAATIFKGKPTAPNYENVATAVFTQPPIGTVGLSEEQAIEALGDVDVYTTQFRSMKHTLSGRDEKTFMKLVVCVKTDKVVGVHMVGADAGEMMQGFGVALKCGATKAQFDSTIGIHPTAAEEFVTMRSVTRRIRGGVVAAK